MSCDEGVYFFVGLIFGFFIGLGIAIALAHDYREDAVQHGAGRWVADPKTGETSFEWNKKE